jgi:hypothetical protein
MTDNSLKRVVKDLSLEIPMNNIECHLDRRERSCLEKEESSLRSVQGFLAALEMTYHVILQPGTNDETPTRFVFPLILISHFWLDLTLTLSLKERGFSVPPPSRGR